MNVFHKPISEQGPYAHPFSGKLVPILNAQPHHIHWRDIAIMLGGIPRFNRGTTVAYYVAQHLVYALDITRLAVHRPMWMATLLSIVPEKSDQTALHKFIQCLGQDDELARQVYLAVLIHDAHEYITGDITRPMGKAIEIIAGINVLDPIKTALDQAIYPSAGLPWPLPANWKILITAVDDVMLAMEKRDLLLESDEGRDIPISASFAIKPVPESQATDMFLNRFLELRRP